VDFLHIHAKNPDYRGCFCSLFGIKIHFREFLYDFAPKRNKLPAKACRQNINFMWLLQGNRPPSHGMINALQETPAPGSDRNPVL
jgi:hypothetical protein